MPAAAIISRTGMKSHVGPAGIGARCLRDRNRWRESETDTAKAERDRCEARRTEGGA